MARKRCIAGTALAWRARGGVDERVRTGRARGGYRCVGVRDCGGIFCGLPPPSVSGTERSQERVRRWHAPLLVQATCSAEPEAIARDDVPRLSHRRRRRIHHTCPSSGSRDEDQALAENPREAVKVLVGHGGARRGRGRAVRHLARDGDDERGGLCARGGACAKRVVARGCVSVCLSWRRDERRGGERGTDPRWGGSRRPGRRVRSGASAGQRRRGRAGRSGCRSR